MIRAVAVKTFATGALLLYFAGLASAHLPHWRSHAHHAFVPRVYRPARVFEPTHPNQTYAGYDGLGYGGVPENPLIPMRATVPLPISRSRLTCYSLDDCDRKDFDESGTRGRLGLGASPYHPEGPGNPR